jgi:O-succinylbenzoate synthase
MVALILRYRPYHRPFRQPLHTHHGPWSERQGWLVQLRAETGAVGWGEVAPLPWFGTESFSSAAAHLKALAAAPFLPEALHQTPAHLPACQFGLGSAWADLQHPFPSIALTAAQLCGLVPTGNAALEHWQHLYDRGHRTLKWKIAVTAGVTERTWADQLLTALPPDTQLRLDANGGLDRDEAVRWLHWCQGWGDRVQFLEQPLPPEDWAELRDLGDRFPGRVALDESVATLTQLAQVAAAGWRGPVVIKGAIAGFPGGWRSLCQHYGLQPILSSALETGVGQRAVLADWQQWTQSTGDYPALGFGIAHWFADDWQGLSPPDLWQRLAQGNDC